MSEKQGPPLPLPPIDIRVDEDGRIIEATTYIEARPMPGKNPQSGGFRIPPTRAGGMGSGITNTEGLRRETRDNIKATENAVKAAYTVNSANSGVAIEADLANLRAQFPAAVSTTAQAYQHELNIRNILTQQKTTELHTQTSLADSFYGLSPLNTTIGDYLARAQALDGAVTPYGPAYSKWVASFKAGYSAKLLTEHIQLLNSQQVHAEAEVQRQAEQLRLENQRKAEEQALRDAMAAPSNCRSRSAPGLWITPQSFPSLPRMAPRCRAKYRCVSRPTIRL